MIILPPQFAVWSDRQEKPLGFNAEGGFLSFIYSMTVRIALSGYKKDFDDQALRMKPQTPKRYNQMRDAIGLFFQKSEDFVDILRPRCRGASLALISKAELLFYIDKLGRNFLTKTLLHYFKNRICMTGHLGLTITGSSVLFVEVKGQDRLRCSQATWIRNVVRPLGLDVSIIKVVA